MRRGGVVGSFRLAGWLPWSEGQGAWCRPALATPGIEATLVRQLLPAGLPQALNTLSDES